MDDGVRYLNDLTWGYRASRVLQVANGLGVFTVLGDESLSAAELAEKCGASGDMMGRLLVACAAMGLLEVDGAGYRNSELAGRCLVEGRELYQGNIIAHAGNVWDFWSELPGKMLPGYRPGQKDVGSHEDFILGMDNIALGGRGQMFLDSVDLSGRGKMLDVGGGPGRYSILACQEYPGLVATVWDLPETVAIAERVIAANSVADRVSVCGGNWETDEFGQGYDVVLMSNVLHGADSGAEMKLAKAGRALVDGGLLVLQEFVINDAGDGPLVPGLFNVMVGAYRERELLSVVAAAGFGDVRVVGRYEEVGSCWVLAEKS